MSLGRRSDLRPWWMDSTLCSAYPPEPLAGSLWAAGQGPGVRLRRPHALRSRSLSWLGLRCYIPDNDIASIPLGASPALHLFSYPLAEGATHYSPRCPRPPIWAPLHPAGEFGLSFQEILPRALVPRFCIPLYWGSGQQFSAWPLLEVALWARLPHGRQFSPSPCKQPHPTATEECRGSSLPPRSPATAHPIWPISWWALPSGTGMGESTPAHRRPSRGGRRSGLCSLFHQLDGFGIAIFEGVSTHDPPATAAPMAAGDQAVEEVPDHGHSPSDSPARCRLHSPLGYLDQLERHYATSWTYSGFAGGWLLTSMWRFPRAACPPCPTLWDLWRMADAQCPHPISAEARCGRYILVGPVGQGCLPGILLIPHVGETAVSQSGQWALQADPSQGHHAVVRQAADHWWRLRGKAVRALQWWEQAHFVFTATTGPTHPGRPDMCSGCGPRQRPVGNWGRGLAQRIQILSNVLCRFFSLCGRLSPSWVGDSGLSALLGTTLWPPACRYQL